MNREKNKQRILDLFLQWQMVILGIIAITAFEVPYSYIFKSSVTSFHMTIDLIISLVFLVDIAFYQYLRKHPYDSKKFDFKFQYTWGTLLIDVLCIIPFDILTYYFPSEIMPTLQLIRILRIFKIVKLIPLFQMYPDFFQRLKLISTLLCLAALFHWISCVWLLFTLNSDLSDQQNYINSIKVFKVTSQ